MALDPTLGELFAGYPELTIDDVKAVLAFARDSVDADYRRTKSRAARAAAKV